jgi:hypothetical protein
MIMQKVFGDTVSSRARHRFSCVVKLRTQSALLGGSWIVLIHILAPTRISLIRSCVHSRGMVTSSVSGEQTRHLWYNDVGHLLRRGHIDSGTFFIRSAQSLLSDFFFISEFTLSVRKFRSINAPSRSFQRGGSRRHETRDGIAVDALAARRRRAACGRRKRVVLTPRGWRQAGGVGSSADDGVKKA